MLFIFKIFKFPKSPAALLPVFHFISVFLLCFLLLSCIQPAAPYSNPYLVKFSYNAKNNLTSEISAVYSGKSSSSNLSSSSVSSNYYVLAGYLSICVSNGDDDSLTCIRSTNTTDLGFATQISLNFGAAAVDPVALASLFSKHIVKPYFISCALGLVVCAFIAVICRTLRILPQSRIFHKVDCFCSVVGFLFLSIGAVWQQVACYAVTNTVNSTSLSVLTASSGRSAAAMCWSAVALSFFAALIAAMVYRKEVVVPSKLMDNGMA